MIAERRRPVTYARNQRGCDGDFGCRRLYLLQGRGSRSAGAPGCGPGIRRPWRLVGCAHRRRRRLAARDRGAARRGPLRRRGLVEGVGRAARPIRPRRGDPCAKARNLPSHPSRRGGAALGLRRSAGALAQKLEGQPQRPARRRAGECRPQQDRRRGRRLRPSCRIASLVPAGDPRRRSRVWRRCPRRWVAVAEAAPCRRPAHRGPTVRQPLERSGAGLFLRRHCRGVALGPFAHRHGGDRPRIVRRRPKPRYAGRRCEVEGRPCPDRQRPSLARPHPDHRAARRRA